MQNSEFKIVSPEIMSPLRHTVRFVNREQRNIRILQEFTRTLLFETFWRKIEQIEFTLCEGIFNLPY